MALKLINKKQVEKAIFVQLIRFEKAMVYMLEAYVAELQNHAKQSGEYQDRTSNLRGSIGGTVLKNGKPITFKGFEGEQIGVQTGTEFINSLINELSDKSVGYAIIIVAGMDYALYVEDLHNLNVLKKSELKMKRELPEKLEKLKAKLNRAS